MLSKNLSKHRSSNWIGKQILNLCNDGSNPFRCANFNGKRSIMVVSKTVNLEGASSNLVAYPNFGEQQMAAKNDVTGDSIRTKTGNPDAYAKGWDRIFRSKKSKARIPSRKIRRVVGSPTDKSTF